MTLVRRNNELLPNVWDNFFNDDFFFTPAFSRVKSNMPAVNIKESENDFQIEVAAPGFGKDDFNISLENNLLTISTKKEMSNEDENKNDGYKRREFCYSSFERSFTVDEKTVDSDKIKAKYDNGILSILLPKREEVKPKPARMIKIA
ncbi:MAG: Hsp20 family protein [Bacteroidales bacterium]|nr:Hsp20 family protein [Bacteroidales bacterium]